MPNSSHRLPRDLPALNALPLYSGLGTAEQLQAFAPAQPGTRKVIIATNVAEVGRRGTFHQHLTRCTDERHD